MIISPIWRDTYFTTDVSEFLYTIRLDGNIIYSGKAVRMPNADMLKININKICQNYLKEDIVSLLAGNSPCQHPEGQRVFELWNQDVKMEDYLFYYDYSYDYLKDIEGNVITSNPVNGHYVDGMLTPKTTRISSSNNYQLYTENGNTAYDTPVCSNYVLYYLNSYGGWDAIVVEGNVTKKDNYTNYTIDQAFDNTSLDFENKRYISEIKTNYELNLGSYGDAESENLAKNLVGSNTVYLHKMKEGVIVPVVIEDKSVTYVNYTNGRKLANYKLNISESQSKVRK